MPIDYWDRTGDPPKKPEFLRVDCFPGYERLFEDDKQALDAVLGGVSVVGEQGYFIGQIAIMKAHGQEEAGDDWIEGWVINIGAILGEKDLPGYPSEPTYFDTRVGVPDGGAIANAILYFAAEITDPTLISPETDISKLAEIARYIEPFLSDEGPPRVIRDQFFATEQ